MQRKPGVFGLWESPFPAGPALPSTRDLEPTAIGYKATTTEKPAVATFDFGPPRAPISKGPLPPMERIVRPIEHDEPEEFELEEPEEPLKIPDRFRHMEFMGRTVKVLCNPQWLVRGRALVNAQNASPADVAGFIQSVRKRSAGTRQDIVDTLVPFLRAQGKDELADRIEELADTGPHAPRRK